MIKSVFDFVQLPYHFSEEMLLDNLNICLAHDWKAHFNKTDYQGNWEIIALRSKTGKENDIEAFSENYYLNTPLLEKCNYFKEIVEKFDCEKEAVRLMNLKAGSEIKTHIDNAGGYTDGFCRIHIPIQTNDKVNFIINNKLVPMRVGECWYGNFSQPHSVKNDGSSDRIHLVIDCIRNSWTDHLFEKLGYDFETEKIKTYDDETKRMIINQLKLLKTPTALQMAQKLEGK